MRPGGTRGSEERPTERDRNTVTHNEDDCEARRINIGAPRTRGEVRRGPNEVAEECGVLARAEEEAGGVATAGRDRRGHRAVWETCIGEKDVRTEEEVVAESIKWNQYQILFSLTREARFLVMIFI